MKSEQASKPQTIELGWQEVAATVFAARGITSGLWRIGIAMRFAASNIGWQLEDEQMVLPTAVVGTTGIGLFPVDEGGPLVFDAANGGAPAPALDSSNAATVVEARSAEKKGRTRKPKV